MTLTDAARLYLDATVTAVRDYVLATTPAERPTGDAPDPGPRRTPRELRLWLARLRLLESVPFSHLVADSALLPPESIRFFHLDRAWTDALVEGALSVGTVTTGDRATLEAIYPVMRPEIDEAERLVRLVGWEAGAEVPSGPAGPVAGFLLRSRLVSGWPALSVRGYASDNYTVIDDIGDSEVTDAHDDVMRRLTTLRFERLAPAVLLVLFDGIPRVVHIEEPRAGVQFGVEDETSSGPGRRRLVSRTREVTSGTALMETADGTVVVGDVAGAVRPHTVPVPFRTGAPGVIHITELMRRFDADPHTKISGGDAATLAMQLLQFPWRSVYGDPSLQSSGGSAPDLDAVFHAQISYDAVITRIEDGPQTHPYTARFRG